MPPAVAVAGAMVLQYFQFWIALALLMLHSVDVLVETVWLSAALVHLLSSVARCH